MVENKRGYTKTQKKIYFGSETKGPGSRRPESKSSKGENNFPFCSISFPPSFMEALLQYGIFALKYCKKITFFRKTPTLRTALGLAAMHFNSNRSCCYGWSRQATQKLSRKKSPCFPYAPNMCVCWASQLRKYILRLCLPYAF